MSIAALLRPAAGVADGRGASRRGRSHFALAALTLVLFLTFLDNTIVSVVLADVQSGLHAGVGGLQWVVNGYALTFASLMLTFGTLGDLFGRKRVMLLGVGVFCAGSVVCALAPTVTILIIGRVVMGVGAAASEPGTLSMIRQLYHQRDERARALGVWVAMSALALALGPVIGGLLAGFWSWRAIFWFNLIFGLVALVMAMTTLPESSDPAHRRLDWSGSVLGAAALLAASVAVIAGETAGYRASWIVTLFFVAGVCLIAFVLAERRAREPVLDVRAFRRPAFAGSNIVAFSSYFGVFAVFFFVAFYLQVVGSRSSITTALDFVPMAIGMVVASALTGRWVARVGPRLPMCAGCLAAGAGLLLTDVVLTPQSALATLGWPLALTGVGFGIALVPVTTAAMSSIPAAHSGMAASMTNTSRELGAVTGVAVLGSVVNGQLTTNLVHRLAAIGIPEQFRSEVVTAVTTGAVNGKAAIASRNPAIASIVHKVVHAAYGAFSHGLDLSLLMAGALMLLSGNRPRGDAAFETVPFGAITDTASIAAESAIGSGGRVSETRVRRRARQAGADPTVPAVGVGGSVAGRGPRAERMVLMAETARRFVVAIVHATDLGLRAFRDAERRHPRSKCTGRRLLGRRHEDRPRVERGPRQRADDADRVTDTHVGERRRGGGAVVDRGRGADVDGVGHGLVGQGEVTRRVGHAAGSRGARAVHGADGAEQRHEPHVVVSLERRVRRVLRAGRPRVRPC